MDGPQNTLSMGFKAAYIFKPLFLKLLGVEASLPTLPEAKNKNNLASH